jgi:hypothetical protein
MVYFTNDLFTNSRILSFRKVRYGFNALISSELFCLYVAQNTWVRISFDIVS